MFEGLVHMWGVILELGPVECLRLRICNYYHLCARQQIVSHISAFLGDQLQRVEHLEQASLPKAKKEDGLHGQELVKGVEWLEPLLSRHVEQH